MAHCHDWPHSDVGHATFVTLACPELLSPGLGLREQHLMSCFCVNNLPVEALLHPFDISSVLMLQHCNTEKEIPKHLFGKTNVATVN